MYDRESSHGERGHLSVKVCSGPGYQSCHFWGGRGGRLRDSDPLTALEEPRSNDHQWPHTYELLNHFRLHFISRSTSSMKRGSTNLLKSTGPRALNSGMLSQAVWMPSRSGVGSERTFLLPSS